MVPEHVNVVALHTPPVHDSKKT
ncbi:MAG: hypothetical protein RLZZ17_1108, partial [Actinomycetota bacterium]